ncbi:MAG: hypothetical protein JWQ50_7430 [Caballeronia mineralivorans]|nr:hypothetical protein [Caballeronia mineralivorans]MEA3105291.1 hypothetical protein [Caballeronia mineralivorans]
MSDNWAVIHAKKRSIPAASKHLASCLLASKGPESPLFMIPLEETSQAGFCFSALNGQTFAFSQHSTSRVPKR